MDASSVRVSASLSSKETSKLKFLSTCDGGISIQVRREGAWSTAIASGRAERLRAANSHPERPRHQHVDRTGTSGWFMADRVRNVLKWKQASVRQENLPNMSEITNVFLVFIILAISFGKNNVWKNVGELFSITKHYKMALGVLSLVLICYA